MKIISLTVFCFTLLFIINLRPVITFTIHLHDCMSPLDAKFPRYAVVRGHVLDLKNDIQYYKLRQAINPVGIKEGCKPNPMKT